MVESRAVRFLQPAVARVEAYSTILLLIVMVAAFLVRVSNIGAGIMAEDEVRTLTASRSIIGTGYPYLGDRFYSRDFFVHYFFAPVVYLFGPSIEVMRLVTNGFGVLSVILTYVIITEIGEHSGMATLTGLSAATYLAFHPQHILMSHFLRVYVVYGAVLLLLILFLIRTINVRSTGYFVMYTITFCIALFTDVRAFMLFPVIIGVSVYLHHLGFDSRLNIVGLLTILASYFLSLYVWHFAPLGSNPSTESSSGTGGSLDLVGLYNSLLDMRLAEAPNLRTWIEYSFELYSVLVVLAFISAPLILDIYGRIGSKRDRESHTHSVIFIYMVLILTIAGLALADTKLQYRYVFPLASVIAILGFLLISYGTYLIDDSKEVAYKLLTLVFVITLVSSNLGATVTATNIEPGTEFEHRYYFTTADTTYPDFEGPSLYVRNHRSAGDVVIAQNPAVENAYYLRNVSHDDNYDTQFLGMDQIDYTYDSPREAEDYIEAQLDTGNRVWVITNYRFGIDGWVPPSERNYINQTWESYLEFKGLDGDSRVYLFEPMESDR